MKICPKFNCAVCKNLKEREVFESILENIHPDTYICKDVIYQVTNSEGHKFFLKDLMSIPKGRLGYYIPDMFTHKIIYLKQDNFRVLCERNGNCECEPYTKTAE